MTRITLLLTLLAATALQACAVRDGIMGAGSKVVAQAPNSAEPRPKMRPDSPATPVNGAQSVSTKPAARPEQDKGVTTATLGGLDRPGLWLQTTAVTTQTKGRIIYEKAGTAANVTLLPKEGETGAGSQISIAAMQVLGIPLTELAQIRVFIR